MRPAAVNPFTGTPLGDYLRDAAAVVLLLASLALPWDWDEDTAGRWWAVLSVLVSLLSLTLPYVAKAGLVPGWGPHQVRILKLAAFVPLAVSVVAALVNELVHVGDPFEGGIGTGLAMALAGGLLAVQPRAADEDASHRHDGLWALATRVAALVTVVLLVGTWLAFLLDDVAHDNRIFGEALLVLQMLVALAIGLVLVGVPAVLLLGRAPAGRRVLATVGFTVLVLALLVEARSEEAMVAASPVEKWNTPLAGTFALAAAAALAVSRPAHRRTGEHDRLRGWVSTASLAVVLGAVGLLLIALRLLLTMVWVEEYPAELVIGLVLTLLGAGLLVFARTLLSRLGRTRGTALAVLAGVVLLGIITLTVENDYSALSLGTAAAWFGLPLLAAYSLTVPGAMRSAFGSVLAERPPAEAAPDPQPAPPPASSDMPQPPGAWSPAPTYPSQPEEPPHHPTREWDYPDGQRP